MSTAETYRHIFKAHEANLNGLSESFVHRAKLGAIEHFERQGMPRRRDEAWRFTPMQPFEKAQLNPIFYPIAHRHVTESDLNTYDSIDGHKLVFVNGSYQEHLSTIGDLPDGMVLSSMNDALQTHSDFIERYFNKHARNDREVFTALNTAFFGDGIFIHVPAGVKLDKPIFWIFASNDNSTFITNPRNLIVAERGSSIKIIKDHQSFAETNYFINSASEIHLDEDARLEITLIHNESLNGLHYVGMKEVHQKARSHFKLNTVSLAGKLVRNNVNVTLCEPEATCDVKGLFYGNEAEHFDNNIRVEHMAPNCESNQLFKGLLDDQSKGVFTGRIFVDEDAQQTNAYQTNKNLLLSDAAHVNTQPQLEIYADDVRCSHGATTGQIDRDALFYLQARGLPDATARALLNYAFAAEIIEDIDTEPIRDYLNEIFKDKLDLDL